MKIKSNNSYISEDFFKEICSIPGKKIILVSGGIESTYIALEFFNRNIRCSYLHNDTGLVMESSKKSLNWLYEKTKHNVDDFYITHAQDYLKNETVLDVIKYAFESIDKPTKSGFYDRSIMKCCRKLKKNPCVKFIKKNNLQESVLISGIARYEGRQRRMFLSQLKKRNTYLHFHTSKNILYAYPFRDFGKKPSIPGIKPSGCKICPVLVRFNMIEQEPIRYAKSKKYYLKIIKKANICSFKKEVII